MTAECTGFLDGRLRIWQPQEGYRASIDAVFLAAAVPAHAGQSVLELGLGVGTVSLCLAARVPGLDLWGIEIETVFAQLAERNALENGVSLQVTNGDAFAMPAHLKQRSFDHVIMNPPYFDAGKATPPQDAGRARAHVAPHDIGRWIAVALARLQSGGALTLVHRADRLGEILGALAPRAGAVEILPLQPRRGRDINRVVVRALKGRRSPLRIAPPLVLHVGDRHGQDGDDFTQDAQAILRDAAAFGARV